MAAGSAAVEGVLAISEAAGAEGTAGVAGDVGVTGAVRSAIAAGCEGTGSNTAADPEEVAAPVVFNGIVVAGAIAAG